MHPRKNNQALGSSEVIEGYSEEIYKEANRLGLNPEYFMALCMLECGGRRPSPSRFEKHVYQRLINLKEGKRTHYEKVTTETLRDASESAIKNLASSWGPFQIMGYKVVQEGILVKDLRGPAAVKYGMKWIANEYGHDYELAFANGGDQNNDTIPERPICEKMGIALIDGLGDKIQSSSWLLKKL